MALISQAEFETSVGSTDAGVDRLRLRLLSIVGAAVPRFLGDVAEKSTVFNGPVASHPLLTGGAAGGTDPRILELQQRFPVSALVAVETRVTPAADWDDLATDLTLFEVTGLELYYRNGVFPGGQRNIRIRWSGGFVDGVDPADLDEHALAVKSVILELGAMLWRTQQNLNIARAAADGTEQVSFHDPTAGSEGVGQVIPVKTSDVIRMLGHLKESAF